MGRTHIETRKYNKHIEKECHRWIELGTDEYIDTTDKAREREQQNLAALLESKEEIKRNAFTSLPPPASHKKSE